VEVFGEGKGLGLEELKALLELEVVKSFD